MSDAPKDGGPAFPVKPGMCFMIDRNMPGADEIKKIIHLETQGLSLRDWLAGHEKIEAEEGFEWPLLEALAGPRPEGSSFSNPIEWFNWSNLWQAKIRYARADAMLIAREGGKA